MNPVAASVHKVPCSPQDDGAALGLSAGAEDTGEGTRGALLLLLWRPQGLSREERSRS